jgi:outer membrane lipoprotein LolB
LALKVHTEPVQAFSADFDLLGNAQVGSLTFTSPLGSTLARVQWDASTATLRTSGEPQHFNSLDALTRHMVGTSLPVASLFSWLQGVEVDTPGWDADLHDLPAGRLNARRLAPQTPAELKIILDR